MQAIEDEIELGQIEELIEMVKDEMISIDNYIGKQILAKLLEKTKLNPPVGRFKLHVPLDKMNDLWLPFCFFCCYFLWQIIGCGRQSPRQRRMATKL